MKMDQKTNHFWLLFEVRTVNLVRMQNMLQVGNYFDMWHYADVAAAQSFRNNVAYQCGQQRFTY